MGASYRETYRSFPFVARIRRVYRRGGFWFLITSGLRLIWRAIKFRCMAWWLALAPQKYFTIHGQRYPYLYRLNNSTWQNERCVEIAFAKDLIAQFPGRRFLEVGHVLGYYDSFPHDVLDKYEQASGVINEDIVDFRPARPYDLVVSVSTLEHVGFDEDVQDPPKVLRAFQAIVEHYLAPGGVLLVTLPIGYNPAVDRFLKSGEMAFDKKYSLKRFAWNDWREVPWEEIRDLPYDMSVPTAKGLVIGIIQKSKGV